ncbi:MAG: hypothetical protein IKW34_05650 [Clostridia bacterium]|nr:hypothetical protein [Clostridia bacterium]
MKTKVISIVLCFVLIITAFAGCKRNEEEITTTTTTTTTETTTESTTEENTTNKSSQNTKVERDSRLIGKWRAETQVPIDENGNTVTSRCTVTFKKDGTFTQITSEKQARQMVVDTYLITFGCKNEKELDAYIRKTTKLTLEGYIAMALANMTESDMNVKGTWKTENKNKLYETTNNGTRDVTEIVKYKVSDDGNTIKLYFENGTDNSLEMILTRA